MTVCAAAMCCIEQTVSGPEYAIIGISDRMTTYGDVTYEQKHHTKLWSLPSRKSVILWSGDLTVNASVCAKTAEGATSNLDIEKIAKLHGDNYAHLGREKLERHYLFPIGLDIDSFALKHKELNSDVARILTEKLLHEELISGQSIVCGFDDKGPHIYDVDHRGDVNCNDTTGYLAIGSGASQFESLLMTQAYDTTWRLPEAIFLMYSAKKKSESSIGVGRFTDICIMDATNGFRLIPEEITAALEEHYQRFEKEVGSLRHAAVQAIGRDQRIAPIHDFFRTINGTG